MQLDFEMKVTQRDGTRDAVITFRDTTIHDWYLGLLMLEKGEISSLNVRDATARNKFEISVSDNPKDHFTRVIWQDDKPLITLAQNNLPVRFFEEYVRVGYCAVDHLDIEYMQPNGEEFAGMITLRVEHYGQPGVGRKLRAPWAR